MTVETSSVVPKVQYSYMQFMESIDRLFHA